MELRHLRSFLVVAELENISRAAERLHVSQPPLSRQIQQLEEELGLTLFERTGKSIHLTTQGRAFARDIASALTQLDKVIAEARAGGAQELKIGYAPSLTVDILPPTLQRFRSAQPKVKIQLLDLGTAEMLERLRNQAIQVAFLVYPGEAALRGMTFQELAKHPGGVLLPLSHPLAEKRNLSVKDLAGEDVIALTPEDYPEYGRWLGDVFASTGRQPHVVEEHDSVSSLITAVEAGRGIAFGGRGMESQIGTRLRLIPLPRAAPPISMGIVWSNENHDPVVREFVLAATRAEDERIP